MPHALFVHSWLSKNKMDLLGKNPNEVRKYASDPSKTAKEHHPYTVEQKEQTRKTHLRETIVVLAIAGAVNAGILLVAIPLFPNPNINIDQFVADFRQIYGPVMAAVFLITLLASGLSSSALGTIAGQVIMEGLMGRRINIWLRRVITRGVNVFPTTAAILLGLGPLSLLIYSQVILSLMIPLPMIPLVYYTSKTKFMGALANRRTTIVLAVATVGMILFFNTYLLTTIV